MSEEIKVQESSEQDLREILQIRRDKLARLQQEGRDPYAITKFRRTGYTADIRAQFEADGEEKTYTLCGRLMSKRDMGKAFFADIQDDRGRIQLYVRVNELGEAAFGEFKKWDIGDIIGVQGFVFTSRRSACSPRACCHCRRSSTASQMWRPAIASAMWISS